jgi:hypothetical protein
MKYNGRNGQVPNQVLIHHSNSKTNRKHNANNKSILNDPSDDFSYRNIELYKVLLSPFLQFMSSITTHIATMAIVKTTQNGKKVSNLVDIVV